MKKFFNNKSAQNLIILSPKSVLLLEFVKTQLLPYNLSK